MKFTERYFEICRHLQILRTRQSKEDWSIGDWARVITTDGDTPFLVVGFVTHDDKSSLVIRRPGDDRTTNLGLGAIWLPSRESDWMSMPEWPVDWSLTYNWLGDTGWSVITLTDQGNDVSTHPTDSLLACAEAWLIAVSQEGEE